MRVAAGFALAIGVGALAIVLSGGLTVTVRNVSDQRLTGVVVHVTGASYKLGNVEPGKSKSVRVSPTGESHVEIEHLAGRLIVNTYLEAGYCGHVDVDVTPSEVVRVEDKVRIGL